MTAQPTGTVTFLFTDVEASTRLWEDHPAEMQVALELHDQILRSAIAARAGYVFSTAGDAFAAAFARADDAVEAARCAQEDLAAALWPAPAQIRVRMGVHTGSAIERGGDYFGPVLNRAARIMSAGHAGQTLVSSTTAGLVSVAELVDLGEHRLKDLGEPEQIFQVAVAGTGFAPLRTLSVLRNNLPVQRTLLVGRDGDVDRVVGLVGESRLVTLTGVGGVGKTRLALAAAATVADRFQGGVFFVDLTALGSGEQVPAAIADAVGLKGVGEIEDQVLEFLATRAALVILDNCEHLVDDVAEFVDRVLDLDGESKLMATSREDLDVEGERTVRVSSLSMNEGAVVCPAVELLIDRAGAVGVELSGTGDHGNVLAEICERLDGIPLAIELAAAQLPHLSPSDLLARLDQRFDLLSGGRRRRRQRQQTLQAVMDWSWELLAEPEQALLARLAVFSGPWHLALAEGICAEPGGPPIVASLGSLVHKSLVQCLGDDAAGTRYRMLETVRLYAQQRLVDMGEANELRDRHLGWYVGRIDEEGLDVHMLSVAHIAQYVRDYSNIRAAIDWAITTGAVEEAATLVIVGSVQRLMPAAANTVELIDIAEELIELDVSAATKARLLVAEAWLYWTFKPDEVSGIEIGRRAVDAARHAGDAFALAQALVFDTFYRTDFQPSYGAYWEEVEEVALASGSTLVYDVAVSMIRGSPHLKNDAQWSIENALSFDPDQEVVGIAQFQSCVGGVVSGIITNQLEISHLLADRFQAISDRLGLATSWLFPYGKSLVAAAEGKLSDARSLMEVARISEESVLCLSSCR